MDALKYFLVQPWVMPGTIILCLACALLLEHWMPARAHGESRKSRWLENLMLLLIAWLISKLVSMALASSHLTAGALYQMGYLRHAPWPSVIVLIVSILALDFWQYAFHRMMHGYEWLWRVHRVHHSDIDLDGTTGFRFHPLESLLTIVWRVLIIEALGIPWLAIALYAVMAIIMDVWSHMNIVLPARLDSSLRWILVTPHMHQIHHSTAAQNYDKNFSVCFSMWDRLLGTYRAAPDGQPLGMQFGVKELPSQKRRGVWNVLRMPFYMK